EVHRCAEHVLVMERVRLRALVEPCRRGDGGDERRGAKQSEFHKRPRSGGNTSSIERTPSPLASSVFNDAAAPVISSDERIPSPFLSRAEWRGPRRAGPPRPSPSRPSPPRPRAGVCSGCAAAPFLISSAVS